MRTCVGCRQRSEKSALIRLVWDPAAAQVVVDPDKTLPGRGAHLHPTSRCLEQALRRRAWGRALRIDAVDAQQVSTEVRKWVSAHDDSMSTQQ
ncbi:DNA-binding protein [Parenemella sanctibonifatiensis]|uniref:DNA-binding protein n=1 Tax=Parenemella sanctibonifatiensis TaxID=2016505 RepID=A0A255E9K3_9ACTN|nr:DNA-binding protein [Parenemella sanctibonifatiensis]